MESSLHRYDLLKRHVALPQDHGSWVFILSPLLIGILAGRSWSAATAVLIITCMAAFLMRQPLSIVVKVYSKRKPRRELPAAWFWSGVYALGLLAGGVGLILMGHAYLVYLAAPGLAVFVLHLYLVSRRAERRQMGVELIASGVLALAAPAAYWVGTGGPNTTGWWLWLLLWLQSAASIVYAYLRLEQRTLTETPDLPVRLKMGQRALLYTTFNLAGVAFLSALGQMPAFLPLAFAVQWLESIYGTLKPAVGYKPTAIGFRQLAVSIIFTIVFIAAWFL
jgi:hypothetical protein